MTAIFSFLMREMLLEVVIEHPLFMRSNEVFPGLSSLKVPVSHPPLYIKCAFYIVLPRLPQLNFFLANAKSTINLHGSMVKENAPMVTYQRLWTPMFANRGIEDRNILFKILSTCDCRSQDSTGIVLQNADAVDFILIF